MNDSEKVAIVNALETGLYWAEDAYDAALVIQPYDQIIVNSIKTDVELIKAALNTMEYL